MRTVAAASSVTIIILRLYKKTGDPIRIIEGMQEKAPDETTTPPATRNDNQYTLQIAGGTAAGVLVALCILVLCLRRRHADKAPALPSVAPRSSLGRCMTVNHVAETIISLILHVSSFSLFVCIFFFTLVHLVEKLTVYENVRRVVHSLVEDITIFSGKEPQLDFDVPSSGEADLDQATHEHNSRLMKKALLIFGGVMAGGIVLSALLYSGVRWWTLRSCSVHISGVTIPDLAKLLRHTLVVLAFVFLTEVFFLFGITMHYRSLDDNAVKRAFIDSLRKRHLSNSTTLPESATDAIDAAVRAGLASAQPFLQSNA